MDYIFTGTAQGFYYNSVNIHLSIIFTYTAQKTRVGCVRIYLRDE